MGHSHDATRILGRLAAGEADAATELLPMVYEQLRALAGSYFRGQGADHTLQPTALVHEAFLRLVDRDAGSFKDRAHFMAVAAVAMRQILTDHARRVRAVKRGGDRERVDVEVAADAEASSRRPGQTGQRIDVLALDDALRELERLDPRRHRVVELRYFGGLDMDEVAEVMGVSKRTVESDWRAARAWLVAMLGEAGGGAGAAQGRPPAV